MNSNKAKISHLFHSSFLVETQKHTLIFDYFDYTSKYIIKSRKILTPDFFHNKDNVYVFVSHSHKDHFDPSIFDWQVINPNIKYILSNDVKADESTSDVYHMEKYDNIKVDDIEISAFGSTDLGVSYLIKINEMTIFHAGDLNWWHWKNDSKDIQQKEEKDFKSEIDKLKGYDIDIAFIPADPRLEEYYHLASEYFIKNIKPKMLIPMHFSDKFDIPIKLHRKLEKLGTEIAAITEKDNEFYFEKN